MEQALTARQKLTRRPLVLLAAAFAAGICCAATGSAAAVWVMLAASAGFALCGALRRSQMLFLSAACLLAMAMGALRCLQASAIQSDDASLFASDTGSSQLVGVVDSEVDDRAGDRSPARSSYRFTLRAESFAQSAGESPRAVSGRVQVSIPARLGDSEAAAPDPPEYGDTLRLVGRLELPPGARNPGEPDLRASLAAGGVHSRFIVLNADWSVLAAGNAESGPFRPIYRLKRAIIEHNRAALGRERAGVADAILLGYKSDLTSDEKARFQRTGTFHLLATAGLHVGIVASALFWLLALARVPRKPASGLTLAGLAVFAVMAGDRPAVMRASIMAGVYLVGVMLEREPDPANTISLAALILLVANPLTLFLAGFQITFATVITLAVGLRLFDAASRLVRARLTGQGAGVGALRRVARYLAECSALTLLAQIGSLPLIGYYFNIITPAGVPANLLLVPAVAPLMIAGFAASAVHALYGPLSAPLDWLVSRLSDYVIVVVKHFSAPTASSIATPSVWAVVACYAVIWTALAMYSARLRARPAGRSSSKPGSGSPA